MLASGLPSLPLGCIGPVLFALSQFVEFIMDCDFYDEFDLYDECDAAVFDDHDESDGRDPPREADVDNSDVADSDGSQSRAHADADPSAHYRHQADEANARALQEAALREREAVIMGLIMSELSDLVHPSVLPTIDSREIKGGAGHLPSNDTIDELRDELSSLVWFAYPPRRSRRHHNRRRRHRPEAQSSADGGTVEVDDTVDC